MVTAPSNLPQWTGDAWQKHVGRLCCLRCNMNGEVYQPIPDQVNGDGGLEGTSTDGEGYQCYVDEDTMNTPERVRKQRRKVREDLKKLIDNKDFWIAYFGNGKLRRWFLLTPHIPDKSVVTYARAQAKKVREANLPFIDDGFEAFVRTDDHFQQAKEWSERLGVTVVDYSPDAPTSEEVGRIESAFTSNTERKLRHVRPRDPDVQIREQRDKYLRFHLEGQNVLSKLLNELPEVYERLRDFLNQQKQNVEFESSLDEARPSQRILSTRQNLVKSLNRDFQMMGTATVERLALGSIAAWLGECSLEFVGGEDGESAR